MEFLQRPMCFEWKLVSHIALYLIYVNFLKYFLHSTLVCSTYICILDNIWNWLAQIGTLICHIYFSWKKYIIFPRIFLKCIPFTKYFIFRNLFVHMDLEWIHQRHGLRLYDVYWPLIFILLLNCFESIMGPSLHIRRFEYHIKLNTIMWRWKTMINILGKYQFFLPNTLNFQIYC